MATIQEYYLEILRKFTQNSSTFKEFDHLDINTKNANNDKIIFKIYLETTRYDEKYNNIIFYKDANVEATCNYINEHHSDLIRLNKHIVYLFKNKRTSQRGLTTIKEMLNPKKSYYIEDLIKQITEMYFGEIFDKTEFITPKAFTFPEINYFKNEKTILFSEYDKFNTNVLSEWYENEQPSILVIKGDGGIGKTTIAKYFANNFLSKNNGLSKIFIDSLEIKNTLLNNGHNNKIDLYDLYSASLNGNEGMDRFLFRNNLDAGNFFLIIDGIDELISKVKNFDINNFLDSISNYYSEIKKVKIIITCRSYFWNLDNSNKYNIELVEIMPFNRTHATLFFNKSFNNDSAKVNKALELAIEFHKNKDKEEVFQPYALDLIFKIISSDKEIIKLNVNTFSKLLNSEENIDYIVDRICFRENYLQGKVRVLDLNVDEQLSVFKYIAVKFNGKISIDILKKCISESLSYEKNIKNIPKSLIEAFKTHPLLLIDNDMLSFKYDFFIDFFKSVYIANFLNYEIGDERINNDLISLLASCWYGSSLSKDVSQRVSKWREEEFVKISDIIDQIRDSNFNDKIEALSGIFNVAFEINKTKRSNSTIENTNLINAIFVKSNQIDSLNLINVFDSRYSIKFDFSNKVLSNCHFENYTDFWNCTFNENMYFTNCSFKKLGERLSKSEIILDINKNVDKNCVYDNTFSDNFIKNELKNKEYLNNVDKFMNSFFHFFYTRGTLWDKNYKDGEKFGPLIRQYPTFTDIKIDFEEFINIVRSINLVEIFYHEKHMVEKIKISNQYNSDIIKYIEEGSHSMIVTRFRELLYSYVRN